MLKLKKNGVPSTAYWMIVRILDSGYGLEIKKELNGREKVVLCWSPQFGSYFYETFYHDEHFGLSGALTSACEWFNNHSSIPKQYTKLYGEKPIKRKV